MIYYDVAGYGGNTGASDNAPAIQAAIDAAYAAGGGIVSWVGRLKVQSQIKVKAGVSLKGVCPAMSYYYLQGADRLHGTILEVNWGYGAGAANDLSKAAVLLVGAQTAAEDIAFDYPGQDKNASAPQECGPSIAMDYAGHVNVSICRNFFNNSYVAIDARGYGMCPIDSGTAYLSIVGNQGCPIWRGLRLNFLVDWANIQDNAWNSGMSSWATPGTYSNLTKWICNNGVAYEYGSGDWYTLEGNDAWGYIVGAMMILDPSKYHSGGPFHFVSQNFDACQIPFYVSGANAGVFGEIKIEGGMFTPYNPVSQAKSCVLCVEDYATVAKITLDGLDVGQNAVQMIWAGANSHVIDLRVIGCDASGASRDAFVDMGDLGNVQMIGNVGRGFTGLYNFRSRSGQLADVGNVIM